MSRIIAEIRYILLYALSLLPLRVHYLFSLICAFLLQYIVRYRLTTITINLSRSFPNLKYDEIAKLRGDYYRYMCDIIVESVWDLAHSKEKVCKVAKVENPELIDRLQQKYNSVLVLMGHCGNFELVSGMCAKREGDEIFTKYPIYIAYKKARSKASNILFKKLRMREYHKFSSLGQPIESKAVVRHVLRHRGQKSLYLLIADQSPKKEGNHVVVSFLNQPTAFFNGPEYLATKLKMPVAYLSMARLKRGEYRLHFTLMTADASKEEEHFVTKEYARLLEKDIVDNKVNWLWSHKRWKRTILSV